MENKKKALELLLLQDLLQAKVIDETIFTIASKKILSLSSTTASTEEHKSEQTNNTILATA